MNNITIDGRITKEDNVLRFTPSGTPVCRFSIASSMGKNKDGSYKDSLFIEVVAWGDLAEKVAEFKHKDNVEIKGWLEPNTWEDKNGTKHNDVRVTARSVAIKEWKQLETVSAKGGEAPDLTDQDIPF